MDRIMRPVWAEIDLDAIENNIREIKRISKSKEIIAVVKADAYGHGAIDVVPILENNGINRFAVAVLTEGIELRKSGIKSNIMILGYTDLEFGNDLINYDIEQTVYDLDYAKRLSKLAISLGKKAKVHIAIDTGMGRIGFLPRDINKIIEVCSLDGLDVIGMFTHFSTADEENKEYTMEQFTKFNNVNEQLIKHGINIPLKHVSNSGAIIDLEDMHLDSVRAGIILYGYYPSNEVDINKINLQRALTLKTRIAHVKELDENMYVSYGRHFKTERKSIIATLPIGYADGYSRALSNKGKVIINGKLAPVIGNVCMDQCMVDVTDIGEVNVGDEVILLGSEGNAKFDADDIANIIGTINYEIICMLKHRVPRVYKKSNTVINVRNYI